MSIRCGIGSNDRIKVLVAIEPRAYRTTIGSAFPALRPCAEVIVIEPDALRTEVSRLKLRLVIGRLLKPSGGCEIAWVEFRPCDEAPAKVCIGGRCARLYEPGLDDLVLVVDEAERFGQTPPEGPVASCLASYGNGGEDNG